MPSTSAPDAPGTAIWLANMPASYSSSTKREFAVKRGKMSEYECACMTGRRGERKKKRVRDSAREGRQKRVTADE